MHFYFSVRFRLPVAVTGVELRGSRKIVASSNVLASARFAESPVEVKKLIFPLAGAARRGQPPVYAKLRLDIGRLQVGLLI